MADFDWGKLFETKKNSRTPKGVENVLGSSVANVATQMAPGYEDKDYLQLNKEQLGNTFLGKDLGAGVAGFGNEVLKGIQDYKPGAESAQDLRKASAKGANAYERLMLRRDANKVEGQERKDIATKEARDDDYRGDMYSLIQSAMNRKKDKSAKDPKNWYRDVTEHLEKAANPDYISATAVLKDPAASAEQKEAARVTVTQAMREAAEGLGYGADKVSNQMREEYGVDTKGMSENQIKAMEKRGNLERKGPITRFAQRHWSGGATGNEATISREGSIVLDGKRVSPDNIASLPKPQQRQVAVAMVKRKFPNMTDQQAMAYVDKYSENNTALATGY